MAQDQVLLDRVRETLQKLSAANKSNKKDRDCCHQLINDLKSRCIFIPSNLSSEQFQTSLQTLEFAAFLSVIDMRDSSNNAEDSSLETPEELSGEFERHINLLLPFYSMNASHSTPFQQELLCLYLVNFLASDRIGDMYMAYERLPRAVRDTEYVQSVMQLERYLMDGNFNKIMKQGLSGSAKNELLPLPASAHVFIQRLLHTVRVLIANSLESAYRSISLEYVMKMLNLDSVNAIQAFLVQREQQKAEKNASSAFPTLSMSQSFEMNTDLKPEIEWKFQGNTIIFENAKQVMPDETLHCPLHASKLAKQLIGYATTMERVE